MRVLLVTQYFHPENFKSNDVAFELSRRGYDVTVLTGLPNYPEGRVYDGYGIFRRRREVIDGVRIYRTLVIPRGKGGGMRLALNYLSWAFIASIWAFFMAVFRRSDAVVVHETFPITRDIETVVKAAEMLKGCGARLVIVGDGRKKEWIDSYIENNGLSDVIYMMGKHPLDSMPSFFSKADVLFLSLKDDYIFTLTTPAKLQAYMASGKPVLAMIDGDARSLIEDSRCGIFCNAGDAAAFAKAVLRLMNMSQEERQRLGSNGREYFDKHFRKDMCIDRLCSLIMPE